VNATHTNKKESKMNKATIDAALSALTGGTFVGLDTCTTPVLKGGKKNSMQGRVKKVMTGATVMCFSNAESNAYENMVKRRLNAEGKNADEFKLSPRAWGQRIEGTALVEHKGKYYLEAIFMRAGEVKYMLDGVEINKQDIEGLDEREASAESQGGLDNKVVLRTFALDSIVALRVNSREWK
jgi:hypothetical protein